MNKSKSLPSQQIEESLERFNKLLPSPPYHIVKENAYGEVSFRGRIAFDDPKIYELKAFFKQELEAVAESARKEGQAYLGKNKRVWYSKGYQDGRKEAVENPLMQFVTKPNDKSLTEIGEYFNYLDDYVEITVKKVALSQSKGETK